MPKKRMIQFGVLGIVLWTLPALAAQTPELNKQALLDSIREADQVPYSAMVEMGDLKPSEIPGFRVAELHITYQTGYPPSSRKVYVSDDNRHYLMGEFMDMTANPDQGRIKKVDISKAPVRGKKSARVTVVEFVDFQCPYCRVAYIFEDQVMKDYSGKIRWVYKAFPLGFHPWAQPAAVAAECAKLQGDGKFWRLHDEIFRSQNVISSTSTKADLRLQELAMKCGVNPQRFLACYQGKEAPQAVEKDLFEGQSAGINGTPGFLVNGHLVSGADERTLRQRIDEALQGKHGKY